jgi:hypothetical protein
LPLPLTTKELADRLRDYSRENYLLLANVIKGVVLGAATTTAIHMVNHPADNWQKFGAFICSGAAALISYVTWTRGVLLTNSRSNTRDSVIPLIMGGVEVTLFAVLYTDGAFPALWQFWFFFLAMHNFLAVLLVKNRIKNTRAEDFQDELRDLIYKEYMSWMKADVKGATAGSIVSVVFGLVTCFLWWKAGQYVLFVTIGTHLGDWAMVILPLVSCSFIVYATQQATRQLREMDEKVSAKRRLVESSAPSSGLTPKK